MHMTSEGKYIQVKINMHTYEHFKITLKSFSRFKKEI